jgi:hypothetical protein
MLLLLTIVATAAFVAWIAFTIIYAVREAIDPIDAIGASILMLICTLLAAAATVGIGSLWLAVLS